VSLSFIRQCVIATRREGDLVWDPLIGPSVFCTSSAV
jgi:hypothetical protein